MVKKKSLDLSDTEAERVEAFCESQGVSFSELVRQGLRLRMAMSDVQVEE